MKLEDIFNLVEARGSGSFEQKYWYWAKKGEKYGMGYVRRESTPIISSEGEKTDDKKAEINMKRLDTIVDLFNSPIVIYWFDKKHFDLLKRIGATKTLGKAKDEEEPTEGMVKSIDIEVFKLPKKRANDLTMKKKDGKVEDINIIDLYRDPKTRNSFAATDEGAPVFDFKLDINDKEGDTLNTVYAKYIKKLYHEHGEGKDFKTLRKLARNEVLEDVMKSLKIRNEKGVEIIPFMPKDYDILPKDYGSKKFLEADNKGNLVEFIKEKVDKLESTAKKRF
jgi:hypothetical protein